MVRGGGARAWLFLKRNAQYGDAFEACPNEAPAFEDAPFPLRRQTRSERALGRFGVYALLNPFACDGPLSPFWTICCMQHIVQDVAAPIMLR